MGDIYPYHTEVEAGRPVRYRTVSCKCGAVGRVKDTTRHGAPAEVVERGLRRQGWVRPSPSGGVCPACQAARKAAKPAPKKEIPMAVEPPRLPTADDKRRIREEVFALYLEDKGCWSGDHSDRSVAERLKVPFAWVAQMRDALGFGPDVSEAGTAWSGEIQSLRQDLKTAQDKLLADAAAMFDDFATRLAALERAGRK